MGTAFYLRTAFSAGLNGMAFLSELNENGFFGWVE
jgi:hypothetical protein